MLYIDDQQQHIQEAKRLHVQYISCYLNRKLKGKSPTTKCSDASCIICKSGLQKLKLRMSPALRLALNHLDFKVLIGAKPNELFRLNQRFIRFYQQNGGRSLSREKKRLEKVINYDWFKKKNDYYDAYKLCDKLKIQTCVYCNRLYTSTVIVAGKERIIRPTLDHWFSQRDFPLLALSFYNLIPSCSPCNSSVKHDTPFDLEKNIHPYVDKRITRRYKLRSSFDTTLKKHTIEILAPNSKIKDTLTEIKIKEIYESHQSELEDLNLLKQKYNPRYLKDMGDLLGKSISEKDVYRILFGVEYEDENFHKRPLSKLKKDILDIKIK